MSDVQWMTPREGASCVRVHRCESGNCVQVTRSQRCSTNACVAVVHLDSGWLVGDTKNPDAEPLAYSDEQWAALLERIKSGQWDIDVEFFPLRFNEQERDAFEAAVRDGRFDV